MVNAVVWSMDSVGGYMGLEEPSTLAVSWTDTGCLRADAFYLQINSSFINE